MDKKIILFGASSLGVQVFSYLEFFGADVAFFLDNDKSKHGAQFCGTSVKSPDTLNALNMSEYHILVSSAYYQEISDQLSRLGYTENIEYSNAHLYMAEAPFLWDDYIKRYLCVPACSEKNTVIFTLPNGFVLGGVENWTYRLYAELQKRGYHTKIMDLSQNLAVRNYDYNIVSYQITHDYFLNIMQACNALLKYAPCHLIANGGSWYIVEAANILNQFSPGAVNIISVLHVDLDSTYAENIGRRQKMINSYLCVSSEIKERLTCLIPERKDDIHYSPTSVDICRNFSRTYTENAQPLKIGFAGRIVHQQKRCDLLPVLAEELIKRRVDFVFYIVGSGKDEGLLRSEIASKNLSDRMLFCGRLTSAEMMKIFWCGMDVYINLSDYEGTSVAMLEAMGCGAVPVVTNVSGVNDFVKNGENGFIAEVGDVSAIAEHIRYISENRQILMRIGAHNHILIKEECDMDKYIHAFEYNLLR